MQIKKNLWLIGFALLFAFGCKFSEQARNTEPKSEPKPKENRTKKPEAKTPKTIDFVDVSQLANSSAKRFDEIFGEPTKTSPVRNNPKFMPGEYREYRVKGHPKGLSVRFHRDKAKRFNLLLGKEVSSAEKLLDDVFKIDVSNLQKVKGDPLSESWKGNFKGINYKTVYAKRGKTNGGFVMLHAEVSE